MNKNNAPAHAKYSASSSERWLNCPGSINLSERAPPQRESEFAIEGTLAHECLEFMLKNRKKKNLVIDGKYEHEMMVYAEDLIAWIEMIQARNSTMGTKAIILSETRVDASEFTCPDQFGTLDAAIVEEYGELVVIDYKYGAGVPVDPEENTQLIFYALGIAHKYDYNFTKVTMVIDQPRAFQEDGQTRRSWTIPIQKLMEWIPVFKEGVEACDSPVAKLSAGKWCRWCPAATICPEIKNQSMKNAMVVFNDEEQKIESIPEPRTISIPKLGHVLSACDQLEAWIAKVREHALHVAERGETVPGWKLVDKKSTRKWSEEDKATIAARRIFGNAAFSKPELLSPAQLEKSISSKDDPKLKKFLNQYVIKKSSGVTLAPASDKREEVRPIERAFSDQPLITTSKKEKSRNVKARSGTKKESAHSRI